MSCPEPSRDFEVEHTICLDLYTVHPHCDCTCSIFGSPFNTEGVLIVHFIPCIKNGEVHDREQLEAAARRHWHFINRDARDFVSDHEVPPDFRAYITPGEC